MADTRNRVINYHSSNSAATPSDMQLGEIAVTHATKETAKIYTKTSNNEIAEFVPLISGKTVKTVNGESIVGDGDITISGGTTNYNDLSNKPQINGTALEGNKTSSQLGLADSAHKHVWGDITGGTPTTLAGYGITDAQTTGNLVTTLSSSSTDTQYPSAKLVYDNLISPTTGAEKVTNRIDDITATTTSDTNYPSVKAVKDYVSGQTGPAEYLSKVDTATTSSAITLTQISNSGGTVAPITITKSNFGLDNAEVTDNKVTAFTASITGNTEYPSAKLVKDSLDGKADSSHTHSWSEITSKPTTVSGYGITDAKIDKTTGTITLGTDDSGYSITLTPETAITSTSKYSDYVSAKAVYDAIGSEGSGSEKILNKVTAFTTTETDVHYPSAKLVKDSLDGKQDKIVAGTNITIGSDGKTINSNQIDDSATTSTTKTLSAKKIYDTVQTMGSIFRGTFATKADLSAYGGDKEKNDRAIITQDVDHDGKTTMNIYDGSSAWQFQYAITDSRLELDNTTIHYNTSRKIEVMDSGLTMSKMNHDSASGIVATTVGSTGVDTKFPTEAAVRTELNKKSDTGHTHSWSDITTGSSPTTISGYGITDAKIENGVITLGTNTVTPQTAITSSSTDTTYPSAKAVWTLAGGCEKTGNKVTTIDSGSTDTQYPSAKAVYALIEAKGTELMNLLGLKVTGTTEKHLESTYKIYSANGFYQE